ncbi:MAG: DUF3604 domain-containing protein [bacterium]|nr:DUF3604 domain-containing protein [bacterium]
MLSRSLVILGFLLAGAVGFLHYAGTGAGTPVPLGGTPEARKIAPAVVAARAEAVQSAADELGVARSKQILFGDLHVHSTFSFDAFQMSLPMAGGDGAHPVSDACDFARHCAGLDFWSINDHAVTLGPRRWAETVETMRQCNAVAGDAENPDTVAFLGWEWTQVGLTPDTHYGHKNVILRDLEDERIPTRPISAGIPGGTADEDLDLPSSIVLGLLSLSEWETGGPAFAEYLRETGNLVDCEADVPVRDLPADCREVARTPKLLFEKLRDWNLATLVIPHGTTWGFYTPPGSSWDKQIVAGMHDPEQQRLIEVMSGHGNSEEYRTFREVIFGADGSRACPEPTDAYLPSCWRAGEIIQARCAAEGGGEVECEERAVVARQHWVDANRNGGVSTVPGVLAKEWLDSGQCRDCEIPSFNYRPRSSVQYILSLSNPEAEAEADRFRFGIIAASDNHSARPGTGYKEFSRAEFTEARFGNFVNTPLGEVPEREPVAHSEPAAEKMSTAILSVWETERQSSFFMTGGLAAVHSEGRSREQIWDAMQRKEVYGTSGPRILLWFDLLNGPNGNAVPMGGQVALAEPPIFQVRAAGSFEQKPGCPADAGAAMAPERLERVCQGECYHPSDARRPISRLEIVRILPQENSGEDVAPLIEDPWRVFACDGDPSGCRAAFTDPEFAGSGRDALYYVRAIEAPSQAVQVDPLACTFDEAGRCIATSPCSDRPWSDDCLAETEERAWSSPIFVDYQAD